MTTVLTFNEFKRLFYIYTIGRSKISFNEAFEFFGDLDCLDDLDEKEFMELCCKNDKNKDKLMDVSELYNLYRTQINKNNWD